MNKTELVAAMADAAGLSKKDAEKALKAFIDVVGEELKKGEKIQKNYFLGSAFGKTCTFLIEKCAKLQEFSANRKKFNKFHLYFFDEKIINNH